MINYFVYEEDKSFRVKWDEFVGQYRIKRQMAKQ